MRKLKLIPLVVLSMSVCFHSFSQAPSETKKRSISQILFDGKKEVPMISISTYPLFLLSEGGGGAIALESGHWKMGAAGFTVKLQEGFRDAVFGNAKQMDVKRNSAAELFVSYYLRKDRKWFYVGAIGGPEWFTLRDNPSGKEETISKSYIVPRIGVTWFPFKKIFYIDASYGISFNLSSTEERTIGASNYYAKSMLGLPFLCFGARFRLNKIHAK